MEGSYCQQAVPLFFLLVFDFQLGHAITKLYLQPPLNKGVSSVPGINCINVTGPAIIGHVGT